jgi:hypothetical protein
MATTTHRSPGETFAGYTQLNALTCANCGVLFAIPEQMEGKRRADHQTFYCPNGHSNFFPGESKAEKYERLYNNERDIRARREADLDQVEASLRATKGVVTRQKKKLEKVVAGVCPVDGCKRHFADLRKHISTKHPDYHAQP